MTQQQLCEHGDFTVLADEYSKYRPGYAPSVRAAIVGILGRPPSQLDVADVGAGTGIWTRMLAELGFRSVTAVEPNSRMRGCGERDSLGWDIRWTEGQAEATGLERASADLLTMASSFHWTDFEAAMREFRRVLRPGGWFVALWNTRLLEATPVLAEIEQGIKKLNPGVQRVVFGPGGFTEGLTESMWSFEGFDDVVTMEGRHVEIQSSERYVGTWRSVNDVRVQLGEEKFSKFLRYVEDRLDGVDELEVTYLTRAWAARRSVA